MVIDLKVQKINPDGSIKIEYTGTLRESNDEFISIDTGWSREELDLGYVIFKSDDIWIETFYLKKNFNIFRIGTQDGNLKGFYSNVTYPPIIEDDLIKWRDLAVDIWIRPDGSYLILDEDEFEEMGPTPVERRIVKDAVEEVLRMLKEREGPFMELEWPIYWRC
jgi:protein associated with RNAse G/E